MTPININRRPDLHSPIRVLILDDDATTRIAIAQYLEHYGHVVATASTVDDAVDTAAIFEPQVLVCDWKLGERRDGIDAARILQKEHGLAVIFVTAHALTELRRNFHGLTPDSCMRKPVSLLALSDAVNSAGHAKSHG